MNIIDTDLLSVQEARIILENSISAGKILRETTKEKRTEFLQKILKYFEKNSWKLTDDAVRDSGYGNPSHELQLIEYYLENIEKELNKFSETGNVTSNPCGGNILGLSAGTCLSFIPPYLTILTTLQNITFAVWTGSPLILVPDRKCSSSVIRITEEIQKISDEIYYPSESVTCLRYISARGEEELCSSENISFITENCLSESCREQFDKGKVWFEASIGNNIVFIEKSADLKKAAEETVKAKSFNNGLMPGAEQSAVVEKIIFDDFKTELQKQGAYFLSEKEQEKLFDTIYDKFLQPRKELIGKDALYIAEIAGISVPSSTRILVVTKPYVSVNSPFSKEKYHPILSLFIEDDWKHSCEKCIELLLNDRNGHCLSIYSYDSYVIEQFIKKKPVAKILINLSTAFGGTGLTSDLPLSFSLSTTQIAGVPSKSLVPYHFMFFREIGTANGRDFHTEENKEIENHYNGSLFIRTAEEALKNQEELWI